MMIMKVVFELAVFHTRMHPPSIDYFNTLRPRQNGRHFPDDIFQWIFLNENVWISIYISVKFVPGCPIKNIPTLVQVRAGRRPGDKPLSEPMMVRLPTHICVTQPQWVKENKPYHFGTLLLHTVIYNWRKSRWDANGTGMHLRICCNTACMM